MKQKIIGTIVHGALGDCYEQLCAIKILRASDKSAKWIGFFAVKERLAAMRHFELNMLDEVYLADAITTVNVDKYFQFQINDIELRRDVIDQLSANIKNKFDLTKNIKPWHAIRSRDYNKSNLELDLSQIGKDYLPICAKESSVDMDMFGKRVTIGYLWR